jgi:sugar lactone lactonase YvrE
MLKVRSNLAFALSTAALLACSSSSNSSSPTADASTHDTSSHDAAKADAPLDASRDGGVPDAMADTSDAATDSGPAVPTVIASFDSAMGQLPEGLWEISPDAVEFVGTTGRPITAWVPLAAPVTIGVDGGVSSFGTLTAGAAQSTYTLGVITDASGSVYYAVAASAAPPNDPAPGIYRLPAAGGTATPFSLGGAVTPNMNFANGLDFIGDNLFVADSEGVVYKVNPAGVATVWSQDPLLAPSLSACSGTVPLAIGANGIVHDTSNVYVTNTDYGRVIRIPINTDGSAGTAVVLKEDCASLVGADGLVIDPKDDTFIIALNIQNKLVRMAKDGSTVTVLASGAPYASPASPIIDTALGHRRVIVSNPAFFVAADAGLSTGIVALDIP